MVAMTKVERTKKAILQSAEQVFLKHGYKDTTIKLIANEAALGYGTIYSHFKNGKEEVFAKIIEDIMAPLYKIAELKYTPRSKEEAWQFTYNNTYSYLTYAVEHKEIFKLIHEAKGFSQLIDEKWEDITEKFIQRVSTNVSIVKALGLIRDENYHEEVVAGALYYLGERYLWKLVLEKITIPIDEIARDIVTMYTYGLFK